MDIKDSRVCNLMSLQLLADYYGADYKEFEGYYQELIADRQFLLDLNQKIDASRDRYPKGLFLHKNIDNIDWFANQRITLYVLVRYLKPKVCVETGVFYGGTTAFLLNGLAKNGQGKLISIDLPANEIPDGAFKRHEKVATSELIPPGLKTGFIIPERLKAFWDFREGSSMDVLKTIPDGFEIFSHDSEHRYDYMLGELSLARSKMNGRGTLFADDIDWSNGFIDFCSKGKLYPLFIPDNGKYGLKARLGLVRLDHPNSCKEDVTG
ncbi:MAG: class I SAM-dependent methyltransferase [Candidatus Omnitrophica bacterium]|nr:class I SAM-dependent methyltransferase [Candidatus Omnitrophota bacterium]